MKRSKRLSLWRSTRVFFQIIYEVNVLTGDVQNGGTDTKVYMSVFGLNGTTEEMYLEKNEDRWVSQRLPRPPIRFLFHVLHVSCHACQGRER